MKSLRQLTDQLIGVRLNANNIASWESRVDVREYARIAINDAIAAYPARVEMVYTSAVINDGVIVLPQDVEHVVRVEARGMTGYDRYEIRHWHIVPTPNTIYIQIHDTATSRGIDVTYRYLQPELPADLGFVKDSLTIISATPTHVASHLWPATGYIELSGEGRADHGENREVVQYRATWCTLDNVGGDNVGGFKLLTREVEGAQAPEFMGSKNPDTISACYVCEDADLRPIMLQAQAVMYEFWLRHYTQYTALEGERALDLEDLQILIRDLEGRARAARRYKRRLPSPTSAKLRRPIPR